MVGSHKNNSPRVHRGAEAPPQVFSIIAVFTIDDEEPRRHKCSMQGIQAGSTGGSLVIQETLESKKVTIYPLDRVVRVEMTPMTVEPVSRIEV